MRALTAMLALTCVLLAGCRGPQAALASPVPSHAANAGVGSCPAGKDAENGLSNFGAYIGTWQADHRPDPKSPSDYTLAMVSGHVSVGCSVNGFVVYEAIKWTFQVPGGRALLVALTELPADSVKVYDHRHRGCRSLQYQSVELAQQLHVDDSQGLAEITLESPIATYSPASVDVALIQVAARVGDDSSSCF